MAKVELKTETLAILIGTIYCSNSQVNPLAFPMDVWMAIAEKVEYFLPMWDYDKISFEQWVEMGLFVLPKPMLDADTLEEMQTDSLYWEMENGNVTLAISMDISVINNV